MTHEQRVENGKRGGATTTALARAAKAEGMAYARWWRERHRGFDWAALMAAEAHR